MKKILLLLLMLFFALPTWAKEFTGIEIRDTNFKNDTSFSTHYGTTEYFGAFLIKGIWADKTERNKDVMLEEIFCKAYSKNCISSFSTISFFGFPIFKDLYHDT